MLQPLDFALRIFIALLLGAFIGAERQWRQRLAGLRTNALVATGAALFATITELLPHNNNPTQIAAYIVSGVGFLAGAVIFKENLNVRGLNTAATIWATAAVGTLAGLGLVIDADIGTVAILTANIVLRPIVQQINRQPMDATEISTAYGIRVVAPAEREERMRALLLEAIRATPLMLHELSSADVDGTEDVEINARVSGSGRADANLEKIVARLSREAAASSVGWKTMALRHDDQSPDSALEEG
ncbi:MAG TPA: MgtC/SapB family protein [Candidatus Acidoferrales bacterium]|nr:MgtC/SapB family protein [Candidatus Acidoferrales bacterium]